HAVPADGPQHAEIDGRLAVTIHRRRKHESRAELVATDREIFGGRWFVPGENAAITVTAILPLILLHKVQQSCVGDNGLVCAGDAQKKVLPLAAVVLEGKTQPVLWMNGGDACEGLSRREVSPRTGAQPVVCSDRGPEAGGGLEGAVPDTNLGYLHAAVL